jgi:hypothetical protein
MGRWVRMETTYTWSSNMSCGVPQRREKRLGNGVKNLSGSADLPEWLMVIEKKEMVADGHKMLIETQ